MDPDANLAETRKLVDDIMRAIDGDSPLDVSDVDRLVELVRSLDGWITRGGYLPAAWARGGR
jgi:hypothetical protein